MRVQMRVEISRLHTTLESTMIYVTHDQVEAMTMGDRIVVMDKGLIQQVADPITLYDQPANRFVAGFIGTPPMNFFDGTVAAQNGGFRFDEGRFSVQIPSEWNQSLSTHAGKAVTFGVRPEDVGSAMAEASENPPTIEASVDVIEPMGAESYVHLNTGKHTFISRVDAHKRFTVGQDAALPVLMSKSHFFDSETGKTIV